MECFKWFIIIYTLSFFTIVRPIENGEKSTNDEGENSVGTEDHRDEYPEREELNKFLYAIQKKDKITSRTVKIDVGKFSIDELFKDSTKSQEGKWKITNEGIYRTAYLLHIVVSCEYSEYLYFLIKLIEKASNANDGGEPETHRQKIQDDFIEPMNKHLSSMILTLVGLTKYTKQYCNKQHEILNILLSWNIYTANFGKTSVSNDSSRIKRIESFNLTGFQVEKYLKQFILNNCQYIKDFETFKNDVSYELMQLNEVIKIKTFFDNKLKELSNLLYLKFLKKNEETQLFVLTHEKNYFDSLIHLIENQVASTDINIKLDNDIQGDIKNVYHKFIAENSSGIKLLLQFERAVLQTITKIIVGYVSHILKNIIENSQTSTSSLNEDCQSILIKPLDHYIQLLYDSNQPSYLINNLSILKTDIWIACFNNKDLGKMKSTIKEYIDGINRFKIEVKDGTGSEELHTFLNSLSESVICAKLHPFVSNVFWDKLYFAPTLIFDYTIDLKFLHSQHDELLESNHQCRTMAYVSNNLVNIQNYIIRLGQLITQKKNTEIQGMYSLINSEYARLKFKINEFISNVQGAHRYKWKHLLLIIVHNMDDVKLFDEKENSDIVLENLNIMHDLITNYVDIEYRVTCRSLSNLKRGEILLDSSSSSTYTRQSEEKTKFNDINTYHNFFVSINEFGNNIIKNKNLINPGLKLYFDGFEMTLGNVHTIHRKFSLDIVQENFDYLRFIVRWMLAVVYSKIVEIVNEVEKLENNDSNLKPLAFKLQSYFDEFVNLPLYIAMPVNQILKMFIYVLSEYDVQSKEDLIYFKIIVGLELESVGFVSSGSSPITTLSNPINSGIDELIKTLENLKKIFGEYETSINNNAKTIGIDKKDFIMMFNEWFSENDNNKK